ncbi:hypothetical protein AGOR_G00045110 [Albula goreensis]|uniref:Shugoshin C-terminal domain-containing protein n=1 Tax=Albula goreensis TaxID=1534307 RepID=A0A8T3DZJ2_9TELE|nr:hypothetical protein AGOR_G00045110 [Albula goreensis]
MVRERAQRKSYQQTLEDIKEKMKEKRSKRLSSACAASRGLSKYKTKLNITGSSKPQLLKSVQVNNRGLAAALAEEKLKVRQAQGLILQMKREQQALIFHLLLLKRKISQQESQDLLASPLVSSPARIAPRCDPEPSRTDTCSEDLLREPQRVQRVGAAEAPDQAALPRTVTARRRRDGRRSSVHRHRRRSFLQRNGPASPESPERQGAPPTNPPTATEEAGHLKPAQTGSGTEARPRSSEEAMGEPKTARTVKSRDRSATRTKGMGAASTSDRLNSSLGHNDTFDFDCEEGVHLTPFRTGGRATGKGEEPEVATPNEGGTKAPEVGVTTPPSQPGSPSGSESSLSLEDPEDSLYQPYRKPRPNTRAKAKTPPRRARSKRRSVLQARHAQGVGQGKENASPKPKPPAPSESMKQEQHCTLFMDGGPQNPHTWRPPNSAHSHAGKGESTR